MSTFDVLKSKWNELQNTGVVSINCFGNSTLYYQNGYVYDIESIWYDGKHKVTNINEFLDVVEHYQQLGSFIIVRAEASGRCFLEKDWIQKAFTQNGWYDKFTVFDASDHDTTVEPGFYLAKIERFPYDKCGNPICVVRAVAKLDNTLTVDDLFIKAICSSSLMNKYFRPHAIDPRISYNLGIYGGADKLLTDYINGAISIKDANEMLDNPTPEELVKAHIYGYYHSNRCDIPIEDRTITVPSDERLNPIISYANKDSRYIIAVIEDLICDAEIDGLISENATDYESLVSGIIACLDKRTRDQAAAEAEKAAKKEARKAAEKAARRAKRLAKKHLKEG